MTWYYIGKGEFYPGVPARDMTDAEAQDCGADKLPLYKSEKDKAPVTGAKENEA